VTPVVILLYNRPELTRNLIDALRRVRPSHVLVVADGPKPGSERDALAVERTRAELQGIDWPCRVERNFAAANLGCSARVRSGLDWTFTMVDRAIILEDDIDPHPSLFGWMAAMLERYRDRDDVAMLCGHNPLIRWPNVAPEVCGIPSRRGGVWGWATWAEAWRVVRATRVDGSLATVDADIDAHDFEPVLAALYRDYLRQARARPLSWDVDWTLRMAMSRRVAVVSPVNFVHHLGVGPEATHHHDSDDTLFLLPRLSLPLPAVLRPLPTGVADGAFDRARVLLELLVRAREPQVALRLARRPGLPIDPSLRLHLLPFKHLNETLAALNHLQDEGLEAQRHQRWQRALAAPSGDGGSP
jgi:hypothetical protein